MKNKEYYSPIMLYSKPLPLVPLLVLSLPLVLALGLLGHYAARLKGAQAEVKTLAVAGRGDLPGKWDKEG